MKTTKELSVVLVLLALLLAFSACTSSGAGDTAPSTNPINTTVPPETTLPPETTPPTEPEETEPPTEPEETEPVETETQLQFRHLEPGATPLTEDELQRLHWRMAKNPEEWYEVILRLEFTDPVEIEFYSLLCTGVPTVPNVPREELTQEELTFLSEFCGDPTNSDIWRISREKVLEILCTYYMLTPEEAEAIDLSDFPYMESTGCYYFLQNSANVGYPVFLEGYQLDENTTAVYYHIMFPSNPVYRVVLWDDPENHEEIWKVLEITKVEP